MTRRGLVLFGLMSIIWGIPYLLIRVAVAEIEPSVLVLARTGIAALILLPIALARVDLRPILVRWRWVVVFALVEVIVPWILLSSAEQRLSSSLSGLLVSGVPLAGAVIALVTRGERVSRTGLIGLLIGLVGVAAIVGGDFDVADTASLAAIGVVVIGYALGPAVLARRLDGLSSVGIMGLSLGLAGLVYAPLGALQWPTRMPSPEVLVAVVILAVVCTALAFNLFAVLIGEVGPIRATVVTYVNPAVAAILGVVLLDERFTAPMAFGFGLVILGSALATRPTAPLPVPEPEAEAIEASLA